MEITRKRFISRRFLEWMKYLYLAYIPKSCEIKSWITEIPYTVQWLKNATSKEFDSICNTALIGAFRTSPIDSLY